MTKYEKKLVTSVVAQRKNKISKKFQRDHTNPANAKLMPLQKRIAKFLSQVDIRLYTSAYKSEDNALPKKSEYLKFELPFTDLKIKIFLGTFPFGIISYQNIFLSLKHFFFF